MAVFKQPMQQRELYPPEIIRAIQDDLRLLELKTKEFESLITNKAEAEMVYSVELGKQILLNKSEHPATLLIKIVSGMHSVSKLKFKLDVADGVMKACNESIRNLRTSIDAGRSILSQKKEEMKG